MLISNASLRTEVSLWKDYKFQGKWEGSLPAVSDAPRNLEGFFFSKVCGVEEAVPGRINGVGLWLHALLFSFRMQILLDLKGHRKTLHHFMNSR